MAQAPPAGMACWDSLLHRIWLIVHGRMNARSIQQEDASFAARHACMLRKSTGSGPAPLKVGWSLAILQGRFALSQWDPARR